MALELRLLEESDLESCIDIQEQAFGPDDVGTYRFRKPWSTGRKQKLLHKLKEQMQNPHSRSLVVEDTAIGKVIAWSRWFLYLDGLTVEEALVSTRNIDDSEDANVQCQKDLNACHQRVRKEWMGTDPVVCKHPLDLSITVEARRQLITRISSLVNAMHRPSTYRERGCKAFDGVRAGDSRSKRRAGLLDI